MVRRKPTPDHPVARWVLETGRRFQQNRRARHDARDRNRQRQGHDPGHGIGRRPAAHAATAGPIRRFLGWCVHTYTAMGLVCAAGIAALIVRGDTLAFQGCFALMILATIIDATDGTFARKVDVKRVIPGFDGRRLDDITDFLTYTFLPLMLIWRAGILPSGSEGWLALPLLASAYGFCQVSIKTDDGYFLGFPSLWNVVALYLYALPFDGRVSLGIIIVLSLFTFVPSRYLYPSQPGKLNFWSTILGAVWAIALVVLVWRLPESRSPTGDPAVLMVAWGSLLYPIYYLGASWYITLRIWAAGARRAKATG